jgi:chemotaxis protein MotA
MAAGKKRRAKPDWGTWVGLLVTGVGILGGYLLERGKVGDVMGESAALIVFGGTLGATLLANPLSLVRRAARRVRDLVVEPPDRTRELIDQVVQFAMKARKNGIVSLDADALALEDPFLRKSLLMAVDGMDLQEIRAAMNLEIDASERRMEEEAKVFESAGGFAPTIGIIGAVLGLIIVMGQLNDTRLVGKGIAAAFVATIYGVGSANVLLLPAAHKIRIRAAIGRETRELILEGVCSIVEGLNPKMIRGKLEAYLEETAAKPRPASSQGGRQSA